MGNWAIMMGLRKPLTDKERETLVQFIDRQFYNLTINDVTLAFELGAAGKLEVNAELYENFSLPYVGKILEAYQKFLAQAKLHVPAAERLPVEKQLPPVDQKLADAEEEKYYYDSLVKYIKEHGKFPLLWDWVAAYFYMEDNGMVDEPAGKIWEIKVKARDEFIATIKKHAENREAALRAYSVPNSLKAYRMKYYIHYKLAHLLNPKL